MSNCGMHWPKNRRCFYLVQLFSMTKEFNGLVVRFPGVEYKWLLEANGLFMRGYPRSWCNVSPIYIIKSYGQNKKYYEKMPTKQTFNTCDMIMIDFFKILNILLMTF